MAAPPLEVEITISSAKDLKNVNWRHGELKPYVVLWVDPQSKCSTQIAEYGDTCPTWDEKLVIPIPPSFPINDPSTTLYIDVVQANAAKDTKPLIGSAKIPLCDIINDVGFGELATRSLKLKRPSGRPHGKMEVKIMIREPRYRAPDPYYGQSGYAVPPPGSRDPYSQPQYGGGYNPGGPPQYGAPPPSGYPYTPGGPPQYGAPPPSGYGVGQPPSGYGVPSYGYGGGQPQLQQQPQTVVYEEQKKKKSGMGVGTGVAVGAVAGILGGLAIAEGVDYVEDKIEDDVTERVENDLAYDDDDGGYGGDDF